MAVEARHLNLLKSETMNGLENNVSSFNNNAVMGYGWPLVFGTTTEGQFPLFNSRIKSDSGHTYAIPSVSRKRTRDSMNPLLTFSDDQMQNQSDKRCTSFTFLGEDVSLQILQQQFEIDRFIANHTEKLRLEMQKRRKRYSMRIIAAVEERMVKRLRVQEEELEKIGSLNLSLEERVRSLCIENQIWRDFAETNEATANALRTNLEQVLAHVNEEHQQLGVPSDQEVPAADLMDDAQSCCDSNYGGTKDGRRILAGKEIELVKDMCNVDCASSSECNDRLCRHCGKLDSCVLLLPCRHLCLCAVCGSSIHTCPICNAVMDASLHVIIS